MKSHWLLTLNEAERDDRRFFNLSDGQGEGTDLTPGELRWLIEEAGPCALASTPPLHRRSRW